MERMLAYQCDGTTPTDRGAAMFQGFSTPGGEADARLRRI